MMRKTLTLCGVFALSLAAGPLQAQPSPATQPAADLPAIPALAPAPAELLGEPFESLVAGISFRLPAGGQGFRRPGASEEVVEYTNPERKWTLRVTRMVCDQPIPLTTQDNPRTPDVDESRTSQGLLQVTTSQMLNATPTATLLRQDLVNVGPHDVGLIIIRYSQAAQRFLRQQAIVQASDQLYYILNFVTLSTKPDGAPEEEEDPQERLAVKTFSAMLDTIQVLDQNQLRQEQNRRLDRTRTFFVNLINPRKTEEVLVPEQFYLLQRDHKNVGYSYVTETPTRRGGHDGVVITVRTDTIPEAGKKVRSSSEIFCSYDRKHEAWATLALQQDEKDKDAKPVSFSEIGVGEDSMVQKVDESAVPADPRDRNPAVRFQEQYSLTVTQSAPKIAREPVERSAPVFYLPQAYAQLLPRLLPARQPKGYLFAVWVGSERQIMARYVDVENEQEVVFNGQRLRAIPIKDRIGYEGTPTMHYIGLDGRYLGSVNEAPDGLTVVPVDRDTLTKAFPDAELTRANVLDRPLDKP